MEPIVKNTNQDIVLLGGCIHMGTDLLLLEIMDDKNYVIPKGGAKSKGIAKKVTGWFLKHKEGQNTKFENIIRESFALKEKKEKELAWTSYLNSCVNLSDICETFQGMHVKLKHYLQHNKKPAVVLVQLDIGDDHRAVTINKNSQKHVVSETIEMQGSNKSKFGKDIYKRAMEMIKNQEHNGKKWVLQKTIRSLYMLIKLLDSQGIPFKFLRMDLGANLFAEHVEKSHAELINDRYIDLTKFYRLYHTSEGQQILSKKLTLQKDIADCVKKELLKL